MATKRARLKPGDVLKVETDGRLGYLHYIGTHPEYGDAVMVSPHLHEQPREPSADLFAGGYVTFYPASLAVAEGLVHVVGHLPPPDVPHRLRRAGARSGRRVDTWVIEGGPSEVVKARLSDEELQLPIASIWNHAALLYRLAEGWHPTREGRER